jgi:hypothetical protein
MTMQTQKKIYFVLFLVTVIFCTGRTFGQEKTDTVTELSPSLSLAYLYNSDDSIVLTANIYLRRESGSFSLENAEIDFTMSNGTETKKLGAVKTGYDGNAIMKLSAKNGLLRDKEGKTTYSASFAAKGIYQDASESFTAKPARIQLSFSKEDSVHTIHVKAFQVEVNNELKSLPGQTVNIYVPRMLSDLKIGEVTLDENGEGSLEYSGAIVGDSLGNLIMLARIEENDVFGNVQGKSNVTWGIPKQYFLAEKPTRELWTPIAPLWMIVTLIIMLAGVWGHYLFAVIQLIIIKRISKSPKEYL